jgi:hypothetical protein
MSTISPKNALDFIFPDFRSLKELLAHPVNTFRSLVASMV